MESTDDTKSNPERYLEVSVKIREIVGTADTKRRVTRGAAFAIEFDGEPPVDEAGQENKNKNSHKRARTTSATKNATRGKKRKTRMESCKACGLRSHELSRCYYAFPELRYSGFEPIKNLEEKVAQALEDNEKLANEVEKVKVEDKVVGTANAAFLLTSEENSSFITNDDYFLYKSTLLDSGTTIHIFNDLTRFQNFRKAPRNHTVRCGNHFARVLGYGNVDVDIDGVGKKRKKVLQLKDAAYCPDFMTNLVSFSKLKKIGIFWDTEKNQLYRANNRSLNETLKHSQPTVFLEESPQGIQDHQRRAMGDSGIAD
ncbi:hypothetical protein Egran_05029 [Elaphomyces granulatus]|uniref:Retrovirus-related Pol polyprotein from transposon TNT 1-94-like beta-barrel domain-containing protein n=1 Tax=Elaphomyces granulatus TaxID=519963 RepID=A0A232LSV5_9EURO|nr:hypothetical protein Egran_05029 [Elaphomyces granulatus]